MPGTDRLQRIYRKALAACEPEVLVESLLDETAPRDVVAIGKCAGTLFDGVASRIDVRDALVIVPAGYREPQRGCELVRGGHPGMTSDSFAAGRRLQEFLRGREEILFLISGGGSACVEASLQPWFDDHTVAAVNEHLVAAGPPISHINCVRKHLSAIKGGRLAAMVPRSISLILSDVSPGCLADVASGPTLPDVSTNKDAAAILERTGGWPDVVSRLRSGDVPETIRSLQSATGKLIADNDTLTAAAASIAAREGLVPVRCAQQFEGDVERTAESLAVLAAQLKPGEILIGGGEPTVEHRGSGRGGRCLELAVRLALLTGDEALDLLIGSSDGLDGNSGVAGVAMTLPARLDRSRAVEALERSASMEIVELIGEPLRIPPTGNNLRDLYLLARG